MSSITYLTGEAMSEPYWQQPRKWNRAAEKAGVPRRVFCASMADVFEDRPGDPIIEPARERLFSLIEETPHLIWQLLTKRPENMVRLAPAHWANGWPANVWAGTSVEDQENADKRIPELLKVPAAVRFLSCEPLLGPVDLDEHSRRFMIRPTSLGAVPGTMNAVVSEAAPMIHWVIVGGESGPGARPCAMAWVESLVNACEQANVACFVKQLGAMPTAINHLGKEFRWITQDLKGGDMDSWPSCLRVRQFPPHLIAPGGTL